MEAVPVKTTQFHDFMDKVWNAACELAGLSSNAQAIPVGKFAEGFLANVGVSYTELNAVCLSVIFCDHGEQEEENPLVTKKQFTLFLMRFGPPEKSLEKITDLLQQGNVWFHGNQSRQASERLLSETGKEGTFLLRYSGLPGAFTVDYIKKGKICHFNNIRNDMEGGVIIIAKQQSYKFTSISTFINKNNHMFVEPCVNPRSHFQWLKLRITTVASGGVGAAMSGDSSEALMPSGASVEERLSNAIQTAFVGKTKEKLSLRGIGLGPSVPTHVCSLSYLLHLDLCKNNITQLPEDFEKLNALETLNLSENKLTQLPENVFASFKHLVSLDCSDNELSDVPECLLQACAGTLSHLDLSSNELAELPPSIVCLEQLTFLDASFNLLESLPPDMNKMAKLEELLLQGNKLTELPEELAKLQALAKLDFTDNRVKVIPECFLQVLTSRPFDLRENGNPIDAQVLENLKVIRKKRRPRTESVAPEVYISHGKEEKMQLVPSDRKSWEAPPGTSDELINSARTSTASLISGQGVTESLWLSSPGYFIEEPTAKTPPTEEELVLKEHINIFDYCRYFLNQTVHANIIGNECNLGAVCISIQKESEERKDSSFPTGSKERFYRVLIRAKQGDRRMEIPASWVKLRKKESYARSEDLLAALKKMLKPTFSPKGLYVIRDPESHNEFAALEGKLRSNCSKLGVVYGKNGQDETQMYNNVTGSPAFEEFLECMGTKINMMGWQGYRGDLSAKLDQDTYYTKLDESNYEIMFHVSTYLQYMAKTDEECQQWERKRFIGNDIVVILFYEGEEPLDPALFISNFNHVFALVQPIHKNGKTFYRLSMAYKNGVAESQPRLPEVPIFEKGPYFRKFLLTKMINAERCALSAPQFRRAQERVRSELFLNLQDKFPKKKSGSRRVKDPIEVNTGYVTSATLDKIRQQGGLSS